MSLKVVEQLEAAIQGGSVDVEVEILARDGDDDAPRFAQVAVTNLEEDEPLDLSLRDVQALHDLTGRVLAAMSPATSPPVLSEQGEKLTRRQRDRVDDAALRLEKLAEALPEGSVDRSDARHEADAVRDLLRRFTQPGHLSVPATDCGCPKAATGEHLSDCEHDDLGEYLEASEKRRNAGSEQGEAGK